MNPLLKFLVHKNPQFLLEVFQFENSNNTFLYKSGQGIITILKGIFFNLVSVHVITCNRAE